MGRRGPAPTPTALRQLRGNPGRRTLPKGEPQPAAKMPAAPRWISLEAKREWRRLAKGLHRTGLLTVIDGTALAMLCEALAQYREAKTALGEDGIFVRSDKGNLYQHPAVSAMNSARAEVLRWAREFGMTPAARSRISLEGDNSDEPSLAELLFESVTSQGEAG